MLLYSELKFLAIANNVVHWNFGNNGVNLDTNEFPAMESKVLGVHFSNMWQYQHATGGRVHQLGWLELRLKRQG